MKLLFCDRCHDVVRVSSREWRQCRCKLIGGQYNEDGVTATVAGPARVFGIANPFFMPGFDKKSPEEIETIRAYWKYTGTEIWWGGCENDTQILRIKNPAGPRLTHRQVCDRVRRMQKKLGMAGSTSGQQFTPKMLTVEKKKIEEYLRVNPWVT